MKKVKSTLSVGKRIILLSLCMTMFSVAGFSQGAKGKKVKGAPVFLQAFIRGMIRCTTRIRCRPVSFIIPFCKVVTPIRP